MKRYLREAIIQDLSKKMIFIVGPRQVGKTWLAKDIMREFKNPLYLNFDNPEHREMIKKQNWSQDIDLLIFDEIHKMKQWKSFVKGVFDTKKSNVRILVTGSSKLDAHRKGGDSMAGRYFAYHLMPFTYAEIREQFSRAQIKTLYERGGFPESYLTDIEADRNKWKLTYNENILRQDLLNIAQVDNWQAFISLFELLKNRIGSPISYTNLARDLEISAVTVKKYIGLLEALYMIYRVPVYTKKISRSILKESKIYFYNHDFVHENGPRFENMCANHLLTAVMHARDVLGLDYKLAFLKTKENKEIDFVIVNDKNNPIHFFESKFSDAGLSKELLYFSEKYNVKATQLVFDLNMEKTEKGIDILRSSTFFSKKELF